ncbi:MAG: sugar ABC transporter permease [Armatimonadota bacterium]
MKMDRKKQQILIAYLFLLPAILLFIIFTLYPVVYGIILSFLDYNVVRTTAEGAMVPPKFIGLDNFKKLLYDPYFYNALKNSLLYLLVVPVIQILAIMIAVAVNQKLKGVTFFRTCYYIPVITSVIIVGIAWKWVFASDGLLNFFLVEKFHLVKYAIPWLTSKTWALPSIMFVTVWQGLGYYMVLYLAGLQSIPPEFEEAARIDGANRLQVLFKITIPLLMPIIALCSIISCISALKVFGEIYVMTQGGPDHATDTMVYYIFSKAFMQFDMGYAAAIALVLAVFVGIISIINIAFFRKGGLQYY